MFPKTKTERPLNFAVAANTMAGAGKRYVQPIGPDLVPVGRV